MTQAKPRFDNISRPNFGGIAHDWALVIPNDNPPVMNGGVGNVGRGCFALYVSDDGYIRFITRGQEQSMSGGQHTDVVWGAMEDAVFLEISPDEHPVQWLPSLASSVRVWAPAGTYLYGEVVHVLAHDTTISTVHALSV